MKKLLLPILFAIAILNFVACSSDDVTITDSSLITKEQEEEKSL